MKDKKIIPNTKFFRLTTLEYVKICPNGQRSAWKCRCECGNEKTIMTGSLLSGRTRSCGCLNKEIASKRFKKEFTNTPTYNIWKGMIRRCNDKNRLCYKSYGGRGISVCERWKEFVNFLYDMGERPKEMTLDRIDNEKGYYKENCRWATRTQQNRNRRTTIFINLNGEKRSLAEWAQKLNIKYPTLKKRIDSGWDVNKALTSGVKN